MNIKPVTASDEMWENVKMYAENCSWRAGKSLANNMNNNAFTDWQRVIIAVDKENICGFVLYQKQTVFRMWGTLLISGTSL